MTDKLKGPFRYDIVGSFLRPQAIHEARAQHAAGKISFEQLREVEDAEVAKLIEKEKAAGLHAVTDGEFRRRSPLTPTTPSSTASAARRGLPATRPSSRPSPAPTW